MVSGTDDGNDLHAMNLKSELYELESSFADASTARGALLAALQKANTRLADNDMETVQVPDLPFDQGSGSPSPFLQLEARVQASKELQASLEAQLQQRGDMISQLEAQLAAEAGRVQHVGRSLCASVSETETAFAYLEHSSKAAAALLAAVKEAAATAGGNEQMRQLAAEAETVLKSTQTAAVHMQRVASLQASAQNALDGDDAVVSPIAEETSGLQHMAPAIRQMQGDAMRLREELEAAHARETGLNKELSAAQDCFKLLETEVMLLQQEQKEAAQRLHASQVQLRSAQLQLQMVTDELATSHGPAASIVVRVDQALAGISAHVVSMDEYLKGLAEQDTLEDQALEATKQEPAAEAPPTSIASAHTAALSSSVAEQLLAAADSEHERLQQQLDELGADVAVVTMQYEEAAQDRDCLTQEVQELMGQLQQAANNQEALLQQLLLHEEEKDQFRSLLEEERQRGAELAQQAEAAMPVLQMLGPEGTAGMLVPRTAGSKDEILSCSVPNARAPHEVLQRLVDELQALQAMAAAHALSAPFASDGIPSEVATDRSLVLATSEQGAAVHAAVARAEQLSTDADEVYAKLIALQTEHAALLQATAADKKSSNAQLAEKQARLLELHAAAEEIEKHAIGLEAEHAQRIAGMQAQLNAAQLAASEADGLRAQLEAAETELSAIQDAHALALHNLNEDLQAALQQQTKLAGQAEQLHQDKENFELEALSFRNRSDFMTETIQSLRDELKEAHERVAKAESKLNAATISSAADASSASNSSRGTVKPGGPVASAARGAACSLIPAAPGLSPRASVPISPILLPAGASPPRVSSPPGSLKGEAASYAAELEKLRSDARSAEVQAQQQNSRHAEEVVRFQKQVAELTTALQAARKQATKPASSPTIAGKQDEKDSASSTEPAADAKLAQMEAQLERARSFSDTVADQLARLAMQAALAEVELDWLRQGADPASGVGAGAGGNGGGGAAAELMIETVALHGELAQHKEAGNKLEGQLEALCSLFADAVAAAALLELQTEDLQASASSAPPQGFKQSNVTQPQPCTEEGMPSEMGKRSTDTLHKASNASPPSGRSSSSSHGQGSLGHSSSSSALIAHASPLSSTSDTNPGLAALAREKRVSLSNDSPALEHLGTLRATPLGQARQLHDELRLAADALQQAVADSDAIRMGAGARQSLSQLRPALLAALHISDSLVTLLARQGAEAAQPPGTLAGSDSEAHCSAAEPEWLPEELARVRKVYAESSAFHDVMRQDLHNLNQRLWVWGCNLRAQVEKLERDSASAAYAKLSDPDKALKRIIDAKDAYLQRMAQELDEVKNALQATQSVLAKQNKLVAGLERQLIQISDDVCHFEKAVVTCEVLSKGLKQKVEFLEAEQAQPGAL